MLNPLPETINIINDYSLLLGPKHKVLGMHLRCAGYLADRKEQIAMITPDVLIQIPKRMQSMMSQMYVAHNSIVIFLSTDSTAVEIFLKRIFADYRIIVYNPYPRGHTTGNNANYLTIQQALVDMYLISQAKTIIYTKSSGFSEAIRALNTPSIVHTLNINKTVVTAV